jgi:hypothetical protein
MNETYEERQEAFEWASSLEPKTLHWVVSLLTSDIDALTPVNRKAVLEVVTLRLGRELNA